MIVTTKEQLEKAVKDHVDEIILVGEIAEQFNQAKAIKKLSKYALATIGMVAAAGVALSPFTGGTSLGVSATVASGILAAATTTGATVATTAAGATAAATAGLSNAAIVAIAALGFVLLYKIIDEYEEVEIEGNFEPTEGRLPKVKGKIKLKRKGTK